MNLTNETATVTSMYDVRLDSTGQLTDPASILKPLFSQASSSGWRLGAMTRSATVSQKNGYSRRGNPIYSTVTERFLDVYFDPSGMDTSIGSVTISIDVQKKAPSGGVLGGTPDETSWTTVEPEAKLKLPSCTVQMGSWKMSGWIPHMLLTIKCTVTLGCLKPVSIPRAPEVGPRLQSSLKNSIHTGTFVDTRIFAFSQRGHSGRVFGPAPIFANSGALIEQTPYFKTLLTADGFAESVKGILDAQFPPNQPDFIDEYDYSSDSDLEDVPEEGNPDSTDSERPVQGPPIPATVEDESPNSTQQGTFHNDVQPTAPDTPNVEPSQTEAMPQTPLEKSDFAHENGSQAATKECEQVPDIPKSAKLELSVTGTDAVLPDGSGPLGRTVVVKDAALLTFTALIHYLYTGEIEFAPLRSQPANTTGEDDAGAIRADLPRCSPKSMYRLADKLGLQALKNIAFEAIRASLSKDNIAEEAFSKFTWTYDEVRAMEVESLQKFCKSADGEEVVRRVEQFMSTAPVENLRRSMGLVPTLLMLLA